LLDQTEPSRSNAQAAAALAQCFNGLRGLAVLHLSSNPLGNHPPHADCTFRLACLPISALTGSRLSLLKLVANEVGAAGQKVLESHPLLSRALQQ
jgi:hypothetical protein